MGSDLTRRRRVREVAGLVVGLFAICSLILARTITVDDDGPADFRSIQAAIDDPKTVAGDVVSVAPGTYLENLVLKCGVSVVGAGQGTTMVDGGGRGPVATISGCGSDTRLEAFTVTNGYLSGEHGGGVRVEGGAPIITGNLITGNRADATFACYYYCGYTVPGDGGGVSLVNSDATVSQNRVTNNLARGRGGGIAIFGGAPIVTRNLITGNEAVSAVGYGYSVYGFGGGIAISGGSPLITRNEISGNGASGIGSSGGGIELTSDAIVSNNLITKSTGAGGIVASHGFVINNTIAGNTGGLSVFQTVVNNNVIYGNQGGGVFVGSTTGGIASNIFFLNFSDSCTGPGASLCSGSGNLISDPLLVDPAGGDYRLRAGSPAIDSGLATGAPPDDLRGQRRPLDGDFDGVPGFDRGAFEYDRDDVLGLRFSSDTLLNWDAIPGATSYHVYSGSFATLLSSGPDTCRDGEDADRSDLAFTETFTPVEGTGLAYIVTTVVGGVEGSPGWNSLGVERPQPVHCP